MTAMFVCLFVLITERMNMLITYVDLVELPPNWGKRIGGSIWFGLIRNRMKRKNIHIQKPSVYIYIKVWEALTSYWRAYEPLVSCPTRSLYWYLGFCDDHLSQHPDNRETGYSNVLMSLLTSSFAPSALRPCDPSQVPQLPVASGLGNLTSVTHVSMTKGPLSVTEHQ